MNIWHSPTLSSSLMSRNEVVIPNDQQINIECNNLRFSTNP